MFIPINPEKLFKCQFCGPLTLYDFFLKIHALGIRLIPKTNDLMDSIRELDKTCPAPRTKLSHLTEYQRRLLAKVENLESTELPFK